MAKKQQKSGWQKIKEAGKKVITLTVSAEEHQLLQEAADLDKRALANYVLVRAIEAAQEDVESAQEKPRKRPANRGSDEPE
jgi:uncharacterized protein (DUF1778 family)